MTTGQSMFLLAAREMNFSRAAEKAFVTPQCLSDHIKRLEEQYHVTLFQRRPRLQLTAEGEAMLRSLSRIQALEDSMVNELADISGGARGTIRLGIPATRGVIVIPRLVPRFQERFPNVDVQIYLNDTKMLEQRLLLGELDLFLGVDANQHVLFDKLPVCREALYLVVSQQTLRAFFPRDWQEAVRRCLRQGVEPQLLRGAPLVQGHSNSTTTFAVRQLLLRDNISARLPIEVSDFDVLVDLCRAGSYVTICSRAHLRRLMREGQGEDNPVYAFRIQGWDKLMDIELVSHRDSRPLNYLESFREMMRQVVRAEDEAIQAWLPTQRC